MSTAEATAEDPCAAFSDDQFANLLGNNIADKNPATGDENTLGLALDALGAVADLPFGAFAATGAETDLASAALDAQVAGVETTAAVGKSGNYSISNVGGAVGQATYQFLGSMIGGAAVGVAADAAITAAGGAVVVGAAPVILAGIGIVAAGYLLGKLAETAFQAQTGSGLPPGYFNPSEQADCPSPGSSAAEQAAAQACAARHDPIVIDLTGNGLKITGLSGFSPYFDFTGNGFATQTSWVGSGNGFLVIKSDDASFGVSIGNGYELLGTGSEGAYAILQSLAGNGVDEIDSSNLLYSQLAIWQDGNDDGVAQANEISSLSAVGIASINVSPQATDAQIGLSVVTGVSSVTMMNGAKHEAADVVLATNQTISQYVGAYTLNASIQALPNIKGYGTIPDLWIAMGQDSTLQTMVQNLVNSPPTTETALDQVITAIVNGGGKMCHMAA